MKLTKEGLAKLHQEQTSRVLREAVDCLSSEVLARAAVGDLSEAEREPVAAHLATCSDCVEEYRMIAPLEAWAKQAADLARATSTETPAIIELPKARATDKDNVVHPAWRRQHGQGSRLIPYAMAASFLIASILLGLWVTSLKRENERINARSERERIERENELAAANQTLEETQRKLDETIRQPQGNNDGKKETEIAELRQRIEELSRPQFNISITDLEARGSVRSGSADAVKTIEVAPGANFFTVILNVSGQPSFKDYVLEIQDRGGKVVSTGRGLRKSPYNTFTVMLARSSLPAGSYHLKLYGVSGNQRELIEEYAVRIEYK